MEGAYHHQYQPYYYFIFKLIGNHHSIQKLQYSVEIHLRRKHLTDQIYNIYFVNYSIIITGLIIDILKEN